MSASPSRANCRAPTAACAASPSCSAPASSPRASPSSSPPAHRCCCRARPSCWRAYCWPRRCWWPGGRRGRSRRDESRPSEEPCRCLSSGPDSKGRLMADLELCYTPATELARRIRAKEISPVEVVKNSLARIAEINPQLNCFCFVYPEEALEKARAAEAAVTTGKPLRPLHGVPIAIKDQTPTKGKRTTLGSYSHEHWVPDYDAAIVEKLTAAGAIMVGKTTTPEFAYSS